MVMAALWFAAAAEAAGPSDDGTTPFTNSAIRTQVERLVPPPWRVESVAVEPLPAPPAPATPTSRTQAEPQAVARVTARVVLGAPTYLVEARDGPVTVLRPAAEPGLVKSWIATALATRADGGWTLALAPQNPEVLDGIGRPAAELPGRIVMAGTPEAKSMRDQIDRDSAQRAAEEAARAAQITELRGRMTGPDRAVRLAAFEAALGGNDPALRQLAMEAALQSRDAVLANLALKDWIARRRAIPVQLYATKEDPGSEAVVRNMGPMTLEVDGFTPVNGALAGKLGAPGYSIARPSSIAGTLAQTELAVNSFGCALTLRLTAHQTLDGLLRCQTLPTLIARITLD
ncbi:hypothetical protein [Azospirillum picis]|uniref:Uncharacterized protein n=1 Tax=Azospirillum picis TaxID=488438 RepID=A0ABU0MSJ5_9PROT|nr:hypothetical protein [Azospirillum picis]MBP2301942.1 hypothetical protein [Azospirillum picis]MDQ0536391.1 hypothetical protein [Azospirillum picis]